MTCHISELQVFMQNSVLLALLITGNGTCTGMCGVYMCTNALVRKK